MIVRERVLILGASGFIGNTLYKELNSYYDTFGTYFTKKGFGNNHHFFHFDMEEGVVWKVIIKEVKPKLIISALRGPFEALIETHQFLIDLIDRSNCQVGLSCPLPMCLIPLNISLPTNTIKRCQKVFTDVLKSKLKTIYYASLLPSLFWRVYLWFLAINHLEYRK